MTKNFILTFVWLFAAVFAQAQNINGKVAANGKPVELATIVLLTVKDSALVKGAISDLDGGFVLDGIAAGEYRMQVSAVGFALSYSKSMVYDGKNMTLPTIELKVSTEKLNDVVISTKRPAFEVKADKTVMNVEGSINTVGTNALDLLRKAPGVTVDKDNNITLKGKGGVRVFIDGKPSQLSDKDLAALLQSMQSSDIGEIELISNPSAKYDAAGTGGIINIKLRKNKKVGFNGNTEVSYSQGVYPKFDGSVGLNYRNSKMNVFGTYTRWQGKNYNFLNFNRGQAGQYFEQKVDEYSTGTSNNFKVGADFFINPKHTIGVVANGNLRDNQGFSVSETAISPLDADTKVAQKDANGNTVIDSYLSATSLTKPNTRRNLNYNLNYRFADTLGHELTVDADYGYFYSYNLSAQPNLYLNNDRSISEDVSFGLGQKTNIDIKTLKADYETRAWKGKLGVGLKTAFVNTTNKFSYYDQSQTQNILLGGRSFDFEYLENVNAAYANYNREINKKWSIQAGLRTEQTNSTGTLRNSDTTASKVLRSYLDWFPSAAVSFVLNPTHSFALNYSRRIDRPNYQDLNPFQNKLDELTYQQGNPYLQPQYTNSVELTHTLMQFINTSVSYSRTDQFFTEVTDVLDTTKSFVTTKNLAFMDNFGLNISAPLPLAKWYNGFLNFGANYQKYRADFGDGKIINVDVPSYNIYMQNTFTLGKGYSAELSGFYASPNLWGGSFKTNPFGGIDIGLQKKIMKDKGMIKLALSDVLFTQQWRGYSDFGGNTFEAKGGWESRQLKASFSYRFGSDDFSPRERKKGNDSEANRIKGK